jgi:hypothetical protein
MVMVKGQFFELLAADLARAAQNLAMRIFDAEQASLSSPHFFRIRTPPTVASFAPKLSMLLRQTLKPLCIIGGLFFARFCHPH